VDECGNILLHCNILCSQPSFTTNMNKNPAYIVFQVILRAGWLAGTGKKPTWKIPNVIVDKIKAPTKAKGWASRTSQAWSVGLGMNPSRYVCLQLLK
jgi:hypothetical protein